MDEQALTLMWNHETGMFEEYDDTYDLTIHCKDEKDLTKAENFLKTASQMGWMMWHTASEIPPLHHVTDDDDEEGTLEYEVSDPLLLYTANGRTVSGARYVKSDLFSGWDDWSGGLFNTEVTHWMPQPRPPQVQNHG
jgi:hypothetical protein|nr:MAG TPA_asm: Protein of unknown function (DUF551) [Caudoviricetes sp.]